MIQSDDDEDAIQLIKPDVIRHSDGKGHRNALYTLDFQHNGNRLATGGGDATVKIWSSECLLSSQNCTESLLASMSIHEKSVNVVRWSGNDKYLASGSDDCYVLIYSLASDRSFSSVPFGSQQVANKENWNRCLTLRGHTMDVLDIAWSAKNILASASIDNTVLIWGDVMSRAGSSARVLSPLRTLSDHSSFVKGISFDPFGNFLASASADNKIVVWKCENWKAECTLTEPMQGCSDETIFRRLSWSPDGNFLCISCATKAGKPTGMVLKRGCWSSIADLVGHSSQPVCCRFNPRMFISCKESSPVVYESDVNGSYNQNTKQAACTVALGDQRGVISVWSTEMNKPLLVVDDVFDGPIVDISWSNPTATQGKELIACCSLDGTIAIISLRGESLLRGTQVMHQDDFEKHLRKLYGRGRDEMLRPPEALPDGPSVIHYNRQPTKKEVSIDHHGATSQDIQPNILNKKLIQKTSISKSGKKRIQPIVVDQPAVVNVQQEDQHQRPNVEYENSSDSVAPKRLKSSSNPPSDEGIPRYRSDVVIKLDSEMTDLQYSFRNGAPHEKISCLVRQSHSVSTSKTGVYRSLSQGLGITESTLRLTSENVPLPSEYASVKNFGVQMSRVVLSSVKSSTDSSKSLNDRVWETHVFGSVLSLCGINYSDTNKCMDGVCVAGTQDGTVHILAIASGVRLLPGLVIGTAVVYVDAVFTPSSSCIIMAVTSDGDVWLYQYVPFGSNSKKDSLSTDKGFSLILRSSLKPVVVSMRNNTTKSCNSQSDVIIESIFLNDSGAPVVSIHSSGAQGGDVQMFELCIHTKSWFRIADMRGFLGGMFMTPDNSTDMPNHSASDIIKRNGVNLRTVADVSRVNVTASDAAKAYSHSISLGHIEESLSVSFIHGDITSARLWLSEWIRHCCKNGMESKVRWLSNCFFRTTSSAYGNQSESSTAQLAKPTFWECIDSCDSDLLGIPKLRLIREVVIPTIASTGFSQSLVSELESALTGFEMIK